MVVATWPEASLITDTVPSDVFVTNTVPVVGSTATPRGLLPTAIGGAPSGPNDDAAAALGRITDACAGLAPPQPAAPSPPAEPRRGS
jgi:hypothetical protein